jgi:hypothetical protein
MTQLYTRAWLEKYFSKAWIERLERDCVEGWGAARDYMILNRLRRPDITRERLEKLLKRAVENGNVETWPAHHDWKQHNPAGFLYFSRVSLDRLVTELNEDAPAEPERGVGGRPPVADWDAITREFENETRTRRFANQAEVGNWLRNQLRHRGEELSETTIKDHTRRLWRSHPR